MKRNYTKLHKIKSCRVFFVWRGLVLISLYLDCHHYQERAVSPVAAHLHLTKSRQTYEAEVICTFRKQQGM